MITRGWLGRFYEDFEIGAVYQHPLGRTVSDTDNTWFTLLTMNANEAHFNAEVGKASEFGKPVVVSALTIAIGQSLTDTTQNAFANLGMDKLALTHPVDAGDTLWSEFLALAKRESESRARAGIVTIKTRTLTQHGDEALSFERTFYLHKCAADRARAIFPQAKKPLKP